MKLVLMLLLAVSVWAADGAPAMPKEITLTSGRVLRGVQPIKWSKDKVLVKSSAGNESLPFAVIKSVPRSDLEAMRDAALIAQAEQDQKTRAEADNRLAAEEAARARQERFERLISEKKVAEGMTAEQAEKAWGRPTKKNITGSGRYRHEQWVYRDSGAYLYLEDGLVTSWQVER